MSKQWNELAGVLERRFIESLGEGGRLTPWTEEDFDGLARRVFGWQFELCAPYRALCTRRGVTPESLAHWREVPAVPATAFKYFDLVSAPEHRQTPEAVFRTSGTTRGAERRGRHVVPREGLYRASFHEPFRLALLPDLTTIRMLSLIPSPVEAPDSSLSWMVGMAAEAFGAGIDWLVEARGVWSPDAEHVLGRVSDADEPVLLLGTALAFVHLIERFGGAGTGAADQPIRLPEGSRIMETGGFKGARRSIARDELYAGIASLTGVREERIVNEYGMTELLSQMYEPVLTEGAGAQGWHVGPPWLRARVLDPTSLAERRDGEEGIISFFDLANLGSVSHVLTEDVGVIEEGRLRLVGRAPGSEPRGCSRAMDDLMAVAGRAR